MSGKTLSTGIKLVFYECRRVDVQGWAKMVRSEMLGAEWRVLGAVAKRQNFSVVQEHYPPEKTPICPRLKLVATKTEPTKAG
jgi:hypothetical protein